MGVRNVQLGGLTPDDARVAIKAALEAEPTATRKVYAALAFEVFRLLVEQRPNGELRDWHNLILATRTFIRTNDPPAAERLTALADLLREGVSAYETFGELRCGKGLTLATPPAQG